MEMWKCFDVFLINAGCKEDMDMLDLNMPQLY